MKRWPVLTAVALLLPGLAVAQNDSASKAPLATLTLEEALRQARANNPQYRQTLNHQDPAAWGVRNAYGNLMPSASVSSSVGYNGAGNANFGNGLTQRTSALLTSNYNAGVQWQLDYARLSGPGRQKANQQATDQDVVSQESALKADITTQYLNVRQAGAQVAVSQKQLERNQNFLDLANAKYKVGQGTLIEVRQAEVQVGQAKVQLLRDRQAENETKLELFRQMGVVPPVEVDRVALTDSFPVEPPQFDLKQLLTLAEDQNPSLRALQAREHAAGYGIRQAKSDFLPNLFFQAGWSGFTQQQTDKNLLLSNALARAQGSAVSCYYGDSVRAALGFGGLTGNCNLASGLTATGTALDPTVSQQLLDQNKVFPFHFTSQPFQASLTVSLPIFNGFASRLRLAQARADEADASESVRARALQVTSDVHARYLGLQTAYQAIALQTAARESARDQLRLAQDRYRLGSGTSLEVSDAQNSVQRAEGDYVTAIYSYHKALAALEAAVGRPLR